VYREGVENHECTRMDTNESAREESGGTLRKHAMEETTADFADATDDVEGQRKEGDGTDVIGGRDGRRAQGRVLP
jgi:hypothetical protein